MNPWMLLSWFLATCLVSAAAGWLAASVRVGHLAYQVASMEAAVAAYWDRIRKRMRVESSAVDSIPLTQRPMTPMTEDEIRSYVQARNPHLTLHAR